MSQKAPDTVIYTATEQHLQKRGKKATLKKAKNSNLKGENLIEEWELKV